jgi:hypothetical protein
MNDIVTSDKAHIITMEIFQTRFTIREDPQSGPNGIALEYWGTTAHVIESLSLFIIYAISHGS